MIYYQEETNENETMKRKLFDANRKITQLEERVTAVQVKSLEPCMVAYLTDSISLCRHDFSNLVILMQIQALPD